MPILQQHWKAASDSLHEIEDAMSLERTLAIADFVGLVHHQSNIGDGLIQVRIDERWAGSPKKGEIRLSALSPLPNGQQLVALRRVRNGTYEPIPYARTVLTTRETPSGPIVLTNNRILEVKSILERVRPAKGKSRSANLP
jgi:hypothetical protein